MVFTRVIQLGEIVRKKKERENGVPQEDEREREKERKRDTHTHRRSLSRWNVESATA